mmetsp:Transcript_10873/g.33684  ORF Transcript_10873/g.33684 Transcript_10873/m.33684 type:complete len:84 (+) Transcript_10873:29-280(+)
MTFPTRFAEFRRWSERVWTNGKREIFFGCVACFALSQVGYREYLIRQRKAEQDQNTPQKTGRIRAVEIAQESNRYGVTSEWKR